MKTKCVYKKIPPAMHVNVCPKCEDIKESASERMYLPPASQMTFEKGQNVKHSRFMEGVVVSSDEETVVINFKNFGERKFLKKYAVFES